MARTIDNTTREHLGDIATESDLTAFKAACWNYQEANNCTDEEAIEAIWGDGDYGKRLHEWAPEEAAEADAQNA